MRTALIGHRGVGKTSLLKRIEAYFRDSGRDVHCFDLDREIEKRTGRTVADIFATDGEAAFRQKERDVFDELSVVHGRVFLALGAGFSPTKIPQSWRTLWVRRVSDPQGRIFTDRPRLNPRVSALEEYLERFEGRNKTYLARADEVLLIDEGLEEPEAAEGDFFLDRFETLGGALTIFPADIKPHRFVDFLQRRERWGIKWFELRDDLLSEEEIDRVIDIVAPERILMSFRSPERQASSRERVEKHQLAFDWPLELGDCSWGKPTFRSLHERKGSLAEALTRLQAAGDGVLKAALPVNTFAELREGWLWHKQDPEKRAFLPLSEDGRWSWFRTLALGDQALNFFRESDGSGKDQPTLLQWRRAHKQTEFAAVLGDPVSHSRTPMEQFAFFESRKNSVVSVRVSEDEWDQGAIEVLREMGLRWAAVTSPLKEKAFALAEKDATAETLKAVNTLEWRQGKWQGTNTDLAGLQEALKSLGSLGATAVWGGGGTLNVVQKALPQAELFSARTGKNRRDASKPASASTPETVIWAVGRARAGSNEPPANWKPKLVIDLNYSDDSPGREFALRAGAKYVSGLAMFRAQAKAQRAFWEKT
jgi:shikimate 5-dehydrogenase/shikimate kinase